MIGHASEPAATRGDTRGRDRGPGVRAAAWRRLLRRPETALFVAALVSYAYFYQAGGWNQNSRFDMVRAIVEGGTASIDAYHENTNDKARIGDSYYCDKAPGVSWMAVPPYAVARLVLPRADGDDVAEARFLAFAAHVSTVWAIGVPSAVSVVALALLLGAIGVGERTRLAAAAAYGLGTLAFPYSTLLYGHQVAASFTLCAFALLVRARHAGGAGPLLLAGVGALLGGAVVVEYPSALTAIVIAAYAATFVRPLHRLAWLAAGAAVPCAALALYHAVVFGGPLALPYDFSTQKNRSRGFFMGLGVPDGAVLWQILLSPYRGLFFSSPWLALSVPGAVRMARARAGALRAEAATCLAIALLHLWLNASLADWQGGWGTGPRYLVPAIPFFAVLAAALALPATSEGTSGAGALRRTAWAFAAAAALGSAFLMLAGTAVKPEVPVRERHPFGAYILPRLAKGELAISTQSIDSIRSTPGHDAPDPLRVEHAWNLGQRAGLDGLASLAPLVAVWVACAGWLVLAVRPRAPSSSARTP